MADKIIQTRVKSRVDTSVRWESNNPVLLDGEIAIVQDIAGDVRFKMGDGKSGYNSLPFISLNNQTLSGTPTAPTASSNSNNTQVANTAYVHQALRESVHMQVVDGILELSVDL